MQPFKPPAVLTTPLHSLHLLPMLSALQLAVLIPAHSREVMKHPTSPSLTADTGGACPPTQRQLIKAFALIFTPLLAHANKLCHPYL